MSEHLKRLLFSYEEKSSFLHRCDPLSKLVWLLCFSTLSLLATRTLSQGILLASVVFIAFFLARIRLSEISLIVIVFTIFALSWFLVQSLLIGGDHILLEIGPFKLAYEGMDAAGSVALRSIVLVGLARVFIGTTEPRALGLALVQRWKLPYSVGFSIFFLMRLLPLFEQELADFHDARKIRAADLKCRRIGISRNCSDYIKTLLIRGFRRSAITSYSLDSRAFRARSDRTFVRKAVFSWEGRLLASMSIIVTSISVFYKLLFVR